MPLPHETLKSILRSKVGFETITEHIGTNQLRLFGRVRPPSMPGWLSAARDLLLAAPQSAWTVDLSRQYFLRGEKLFFGWRVIVQGQDVQQHLNQVSQVVNNVQVAVRQLDEVALHAPPNRNALRNGRGAQETLKAVVGPMAKAGLNM